MLLPESLNQEEKCCPLLQRDRVQPVRTIEKHLANPAWGNTVHQAISAPVSPPHMDPGQSIWLFLLLLNAIHTPIQWY